MQNTPKTPLVIHHLESWDINKKLRYNINNGVVLLKTIHKDFHNCYGFGNNTKLQFEIYCIEKYNIQNFPWRYGNHEPSFILNTKTLKEKKEQEFDNLLNYRNHKKISGVYKTFSSTVEILCLSHNKITKTTYNNYKKSKFGCLCCARQKQSEVVSKANRLRKQNFKNNFSNNKKNKEGAETRK